MSASTRRTLLQQSGIGLAGHSLLPGRTLAALPSAPSLRIRAASCPGAHGYAEQGVAAGGTIRFHVSSAAPHQLSIYRLGLDPESPDQDVWADGDK